MDQLLPHYERELSLLREQSQAFAQRYPKVAGALQMRGDVAQDPHVERMIESFALLAARVHKRLDDDFPLFTESLLQVLYPHYLRPFPSCSIAHLDVGPLAGQMTKPVHVPRGTSLLSRPVKGVACRFRTTQDVVLLPVQISHASYRNAVQAPAGTRLPGGATSVLSLTLSLQSPQASWAMLADRPLRIHLDGEPSQVSVLREALTRRVVGVMGQVSPHQPWWTANQGPEGQALRPTLVGFDDAEALLDWDDRAHPAYRLLTEYFAFPEKFNFIDLPVRWPAGVSLAGEAEGPAAMLSGGSGQRQITLHILMAGVRSDSDESRLLESVHARNLLLGCTPVINLFQQPADPIRVTHTQTAYPVLVDGRRAFGHEVYSIDKVFRVQQTAQGEAVHAFKPFFSLQHDELLGGAEDGAGHVQTQRAGGRYWTMQRDEDVAQVSPGYEVSLSIVDIDFDPTSPQTDTLSLTVTATNRDLPALLPFGVPGGDLFMDGGGPAKSIGLLRKPTVSQRFDVGRGALWRLISHLSLNHLSLSAGGIDALKEMLRLYDLPRSATNRRQVDGVQAITFGPGTAWLPGEPYATFVRGTAVSVTVDEEAFVGTGLGLFAAVMDHFFGLYVHANSFVQLTWVSARTQEVLLTCPPRNGNLLLM